MYMTVLLAINMVEIQAGKVSVKNILRTNF